MNATKKRATVAWRENLARWLVRVRTAGKALVVAGSAVAILGFALPALWSWVKHHPYFALSDVVVRGQARVSREDILAWTGVRFGTSTWEIDPAAIQAVLERQAWIQQATVATELPNRLVVTVHERKPMALARLDQFYYVDRRGHLLGPLGEQDSRDFPVITGLEEEPPERASLVLPRAAQLIRWCERSRCFGTISEVRVDRDRVLTVYPMQPRVAVIFGWGGWKSKMDRLKKVLARYEGSESRLATVDLSFPGAAVVKLKEEPTPPVPSGRKTKV